MDTNNTTKITVQTIVNCNIAKAWYLWTNPEDIKAWNNASADWHTTNAVNNLHKGGKFNYRMEAKDGSFGFDFSGTYKNVILHKQMNVILDDNRELDISFISKGNTTEIIECFDAENQNPVELQRIGWQNILDNFKKHAESK